MRVRGRDSRGHLFEEETSSENLCRSGAAFLTRFDVAIGSDLEIHIPLSYSASRRVDPERLGVATNSGVLRNDTDFATRGKVVHIGDSQPEGEKLVGVRFTGPRFQRVFRSESAS